MDSLCAGDWVPAPGSQTTNPFQKGPRKGGMKGQDRGEGEGCPPRLARGPWPLSSQRMAKPPPQNVTEEATFFFLVLPVPRLVTPYLILDTLQTDDNYLTE